jgi:purine-binding chemotaxis protein CheW
LPDRIADLRRAFDHTFASPRGQARDEVEQLLAIRVAGHPCALKVREIAGLATGRRIVSLPSQLPELLGIAGIRGALVPVYGLSALLGYDQGTAQHRWLVQCGTEEPIALAFEEFEGHLRAPRSDVYVANRTEAARRHVKEVVRAGAMVRAVVDIASVVEAVKARGRPGNPSKE